MKTSSNGNIFRVTGPLWGVTGGLSSQRSVTRSFDVFYDLWLNKQLSKQSRRRWPWWRHQMETFSALLALSFPSQRPMTRSLMFSSICAWTNGCANNQDAGDLRRHRCHYDVTVMQFYMIDQALYIFIEYSWRCHIILRNFLGNVWYWRYVITDSGNGLVLSSWARGHCPEHKMAYNRTTRHDDVIRWKHFPRHWPFLRVIQRSPVNSPHKSQWRGALMFPLICAWTNGWLNNRDAGHLRRHRARYDVTVMANICQPKSSSTKLRRLLGLLIFHLWTSKFIHYIYIYHALNRILAFWLMLSVFFTELHTICIWV